jgi:hypothetical protein
MILAALILSRMCSFAEKIRLSSVIIRSMQVSRLIRLPSTFEIFRKNFSTSASSSGSFFGFCK